MNDLLVQVRTVLSTSATRWQILTETIPLELLTLIPAAGEWSALDCLQHMIDTEKQVFPLRLQAFLAGRNFPAFDPDSKDHKPIPKPVPSRLSLEFTNLRKASLELVNKVTISDLSRTAQHSELGQVTLGEMMCEWAGHDLMHIVQAERAIMQYFIPGTGPWRTYFSDHDVESIKNLKK